MKPNRPVIRVIRHDPVRRLRLSERRVTHRLHFVKGVLAIRRLLGQSEFRDRGRRRGVLGTFSVTSEPASEVTSEAKLDADSDFFRSTLATASASCSTALCFGGSFGSSCLGGCGLGASGAFRKMSAAVGAAGLTGATSGAFASSGLVTFGAGGSVDFGSGALGATGAGVGFGGLAGFAAIAAKRPAQASQAPGPASASAPRPGPRALATQQRVERRQRARQRAQRQPEPPAEVAGAPTLTSCLVFGLTILIALLADFTGGVEGDDGGFMPGGLAYAGTPIGGTPIIMPILNGALPGVNI